MDDIPVHKSSHTLRQKLAHAKDKTPKHILNNRKTKQPPHKHMAQDRRATSTGPDSASKRKKVNLSMMLMYTF